MILCLFIFLLFIIYKNIKQYKSYIKIPSYNCKFNPNLKLKLIELTYSNFYPMDKMKIRLDSQIYSEYMNKKETALMYKFIKTRQKEYRCYYTI